METLSRLARTRRTYIVLLVAGVVFFFIGNLGGKKGNPTWLLAPLCLLLMLAFGIIVFVHSRRTQS